MSDPAILTDRAALEKFAGELLAEKAIGVDLEADSMHSYQEKVCLLQFSTPTRTVLVDPLAVGDLSPLAKVLAEPQIRKIMHAADYDIRCLYRDFALEVRGLFDTMVCCQFLGEPKVGLADILLKEFGVRLDKKYQRADWSKRPLGREMISYAAEDTRHLHGLAALLEKRLEAKGRLSWVAEEFTLLEQVRHAERREDFFFLRVKGANRLEARQLAVLEELLVWRDREAQKHDRPPFKIIGNLELLAIARQMPTTIDAIRGVAEVGARLFDRYALPLLAAVRAGLAWPEGSLPGFPPSPRIPRVEGAEDRLRQLKKWRAMEAEKLGMDAGIVINTSLLEELAQKPPRRLQDIDRCQSMKKWQSRVLGEGILAALSERG